MPPCISEADRFSLEALRHIHKQLDDDNDGGIEVNESVEVRHGGFGVKSGVAGVCVTGLFQTDLGVTQVASSFSLMHEQALQHLQFFP